MNRATRARELAGLSVGQAARLLDTTSADELREVESCRDVPPAWVDRLCELYRVRPEWLCGEVPQHDYATVDSMKGADKLCSHDRDAIAEFSALLRRKPPKVEPPKVVDLAARRCPPGFLCVHEPPCPGTAR